MILSGRVSIKMAPVVRRIYDQMLEPKWAIAMGACSSSMGVFNNYAIVPADKFMPVDVHVPGCPPRPEALMHGILKLRAMIQAHPDEGWRTRYGGHGTEEISPRAPSLPDATGLELIAQELRDAHSDAVLDTVHFRDKAALTVAAPVVRETLELLHGKGYTFLASVHGVDYFPEEPRLGVHYELLDMTAVDRITVKVRVPLDEPDGAERDARVADRRPPGARGLRHVRRRLRRPSRPAPHPHARGLRGPSAAARLPDRRRAGPLHAQRAATCRGGGSEQPRRACRPTGRWRTRTRSRRSSTRPRASRSC